MLRIIGLILLLNTGHAYGQQKWYSFSKSDIATLSLEAGAGYAQGWREEVLYHPNALFKHFPNLNRNFWDSRISWQGGGIKDANHLLKAGVTSMHIAAVVVRISDIQKFKGWRRVLKITGDGIKHYAAYQLGFFLAYNVTHKNHL